jgi:hypothetical protein
MDPALCCTYIQKCKGASCSVKCSEGKPPNITPILSGLFLPLTGKPFPPLIEAKKIIDPYYTIGNNPRPGVMWPNNFHLFAILLTLELATLLACTSLEQIKTCPGSYMDCIKKSVCKQYYWCFGGIMGFTTLLSLVNLALGGGVIFVWRSLQLAVWFSGVCLGNALVGALNC